jgi:polyisoprenoid-binding protein YceI
MRRDVFAALVRCSARLLVVACVQLSLATALLTSAARHIDIARVRNVSPLVADAQPLARYRLDAAQSRFMVRTFSGGLLWFKGHDHFIAARDFNGEVELTPTGITPATLTLTVRAASLTETRDVFTEPQKQIINREINELVLESGKYPEITFRSTQVTVNPKANGFDVRLTGDLTLHGVTRHITIPALVNLSGNDLHARGEFTIKRSDYNVKATSAVHGTIRVRNKLKLSFDIVAHHV